MPRLEAGAPSLPPAARAKRSVAPVIGDRDPDGPIWRGDAFHADLWRHADANEALPDGPVVVPKTMWLAERGRLRGRAAPVGLRLEPGEAIDDLAEDLAHFALIALAFPKFSDGRAFSTARLLREKHGYSGELRAVGNVLTDQIPFMRRVGFDAFEVTHGPTRRALAAGRVPEVSLQYQPSGAPQAGGRTRPWLGRSPDRA
jgi:uncharacterized protein (DUF934 family)